MKLTFNGMCGEMKFKILVEIDLQQVYNIKQRTNTKMNIKRTKNQILTKRIPDVIRGLSCRGDECPLAFGFSFGFFI